MTTVTTATTCGATSGLGHQTTIGVQHSSTKKKKKKNVSLARIMRLIFSTKRWENVASTRRGLCRASSSALHPHFCPSSSKATLENDDDDGQQKMKKKEQSGRGRRRCWRTRHNVEIAKRRISSDDFGEERDRRRSDAARNSSIQSIGSIPVLLVAPAGKIPGNNFQRSGKGSTIT